MARFRFFSDTNQAHFEDALSRAGLAYSHPELYMVAVVEPPGWVGELARELGGDEVA
jgi:hypothetical protein